MQVLTIHLEVFTVFHESSTLPQRTLLPEASIFMKLCLPRLYPHHCGFPRQHLIFSDRQTVQAPAPESCVITEHCNLPFEKINMIAPLRK